MWDFHLNTGGVLGSLSCAALSIAFVAMVFPPTLSGEAIGQLFILAALVGGATGNHLWKKRSDKNNSQADDDWNN